MNLGVVVGKIISTKKDPKIIGNIIKVVELIDPDGKPTGEFEIAADTVGSKKGDYVITVSSSSARMTKLTENKPLDTAIVAIVDIITENGVVKYKNEV